VEADEVLVDTIRSPLHTVDASPHR